MRTSSSSGWSGEAGNAIGALVWIPRDGADAHREASLNVPGIEVLGHRYDTFWEWVGSRRTDVGVVRPDLGRQEQVLALALPAAA